GIILLRPNQWNAKMKRKSTSAKAADKGSVKKSAPKEHKPLMHLPMNFYAVPMMKKACLEPHDTYIKHLFVKVRQEGETATLIVSNISVDDTTESLKNLFETLLD